jgi:hypothetical protein
LEAFQELRRNLVWAYASSNDICFNNKIKSNKLLAIKLEENCNEMVAEP